MMDLKKALFERDLTEAEEESLGQVIASSPEEALALAEEARKTYESTGLPVPNAPEDAGFLNSNGVAATGGMGTALKIVLGSVLFLGLAAVVMIQRTGVSDTAPETSPAARQESPAAPPDEAPAASIQPKAWTTPRLALPNEQFPKLSVVVRRDGPGLVTVRVVDSAGEEIQLLYAGILKEGEWVFPWHGRAETGAIAPPGRYRIEVKSGGGTRYREVDLAAGAP